MAHLCRRRRRSAFPFGGYPSGGFGSPIIEEKVSKTCSQASETLPTGSREVSAHLASMLAPLALPLGANGLLFALPFAIIYFS